MYSISFNWFKEMMRRGLWFEYYQMQFTSKTSRLNSAQVEVGLELRMSFAKICKNGIS